MPLISKLRPLCSALCCLSQLSQTLVSRETSPLGSAVVSVPMFEAGDAHNVIPNTVTLMGTLRAFTPEHMHYLQRRIK